MSMKYFTIEGLSPALDGVDAKVDISTDESVSDDSLYCISELRNRAVLIGDRQLTFQIPLDALHIKGEYLKECKYQDEMEFSSENSYGAFRCSVKYSFDPVVVTVSEYENVSSVAVANEDETSYESIYNQNFFGALNRGLLRTGLQVLVDGKIDTDDFIVYCQLLTKGDVAKWSRTEQAAFQTGGFTDLNDLLEDE